MREGDAVHTAAGKAFYVAIASMWRLKKEASDFVFVIVVVATGRLDQAIVGRTVEIESTIFHCEKYLNTVFRAEAERSLGESEVAVELSFSGNGGKSAAGVG